MDSVLMCFILFIYFIYLFIVQINFKLKLLK